MEGVAVEDVEFAENFEHRALQHTQKENQHLPSSPKHLLPTPVVLVETTYHFPETLTIYYQLSVRKKDNKKKIMLRASCLPFATSAKNDSAVRRR